MSLAEHSGDPFVPGTYTLLFCNGAYPGARIVRRLSRGAAHIVCADGGANMAHRLGIRPELVVGDLDSITAEAETAFRESGVPIVRLRRQTDTDLEKALKYAIRLSKHRVIILGATGGMLDHTLGNLSVILRYVNVFSITLIDPLMRLDIITGSASFKCNKGDRISLIPLLPSLIGRTKGLQYRISNMRLEPGLAEGTCNKAVNGEFTIELIDGVLMVTRPFDDKCWGSSQ
jgi:thiamine pyrophosphokinase